MPISLRNPMFLIDHIRAVGLRSLDWFSAGISGENHARATARLTDRVQIGISAKRATHASSHVVAFAHIDATDPTARGGVPSLIECTTSAAEANPFLIYGEIDAEIERRREDLAELEEARHRLVVSQRAAGLDPPALKPWPSAPHDAPHVEQAAAVDWHGVATKTTLGPALAERVADEVGAMLAEVDADPEAETTKAAREPDPMWTPVEPLPF